MNVAFVCVHNSCRSQIAEALSKQVGAGIFEAYSAGTYLKDRINPDAVRLMKDRFGIDMELTQHPKLIGELPPIDLLITMGCGVECPYLPCRYREDWGLEDPTGKDDNAFLKTIELIEARIIGLAARVRNGEFDTQNRTHC